MSKLKFVDEAVRTTSTTGQRHNVTFCHKGHRQSPSYRDGDNNQHENKWYLDHAVPSGATKGSLKNTPEFKFD